MVTTSFSPKKMILICCLGFIGLLNFELSYGQQKETGLASYYNDNLQGRLTASGQAYDTIKMTAAHRSLPFFTRLKVTHASTKKAVFVIVNDRGPFVEGRIVDLSKAAAKKLGIVEEGVAKVVVEIIEKE